MQRRTSLLPWPRPTARHSWVSSRDPTQCQVRGWECTACGTSYSCVTHVDRPVSHTVTESAKDSIGQRCLLSNTTAEAALLVAGPSGHCCFGQSTCYVACQLLNQFAGGRAAVLMRVAPAAGGGRILQALRTGGAGK